MPGGGLSNASISVVERGDTFAGFGAACSGSIGITEAHDLASLAGMCAGVGVLSHVESHDSPSFVGTCIVATMGVTDGRDTMVAGAAAVAATIGQTERRDTGHLFGTFTQSGSIGPTETGDATSLVGLFTASGSIGRTESHDSPSFAGAYGYAFFTPTEGHDSFAGSAIYGPKGSIGRSDGRDTMVGAAGLLVTATMGVVERHDLLVAANIAAEYHIYENTGTGDPINYQSIIATTGLLTWTSGPLTFPGVWRFGVRAFGTSNSLEEDNLDASVTLILDASGNDITSRPSAPFGLRGFATAGGGIRVEWAYNTINPSPIPTGFHVYRGTGGTPSYGSPVATVSFASSIAGTFVANLTGGSNGIVYTVGVRAYNATAEEPNTNTVNVTALSIGPTAVIDLTATAIV